MVEKFKTILQQMIRGKGAVTFFAIMKLDDLVDKWSVVLCAPWAAETNHDVAFSYVLDLMKANLDARELSSIARISIFPKTEHLIQLLLRFKEGTILENQKVNGNVVYQGYILESRREI